jgi:HlyD family secretion protein
LGDSANVKVDAYGDRKFSGVVTEIANSAKFNVAQSMNEQVTNYTVKIRINRSSYTDLITKKTKQPFLPGMTASVDIKTNQQSNVLSIPISALTTRNPTLEQGDQTLSGAGKTKTWVFVLSNGKAKSVEIETGIQDIDYFEIKKGLKEGEEVITEPSMAIAKTMMNGDKVKKKP